MKGRFIRKYRDEGMIEQTPYFNSRKLYVVKGLKPTIVHKAKTSL